MDVVRRGDREEWKYDGFKLREDDEGRLEGDGCGDMK